MNDIGQFVGKELCEALVEPDGAPPLAGYEISEDLMGSGGGSGL
jgi:hypothetical protein